MQPLQALHQKFNVANPAAGQLDIQARIHLLGSQLFVNSGAGFRNSFDGVEIESRGIDQRLDKFQQLAARVRLPGRHAGFDEHLQLPIPAALLVVFVGAFERDGDLAVTPVRPQPQIDAVTLALGRVGGEQIGAAVGDFLEEFLVRDGLATIGVAVCGVDEHQIDVGAVVQFLAAQFAERDHAESALARRIVRSGVARRPMARD